MANNQTFMTGIGTDGGQITTLSDVQSRGLKLPTSNFINIRRSGKIETLFLTNGNSKTLYSDTKTSDSYLKGPVSSGFVYTNIEVGLNNKLRTSSQAATRDSRRITKFLGSSRGIKFILNQIVLQGKQAFDETKVYNPASPIISAIRLASFGLVDRPTRHLDTSNIIGGLLGGTGLGSIVNKIGGLFGGGSPPLPSPPRSSVASGASGGLGISTFTSLLGGSDKSDKVVSILARPDVKDLLRGQTATNAYNAPRYSKLVSGGSSKGFLGNLLKGVGNYFVNNTILGGIIPPKQPWSANYRADEETYDLYLNAGKLFNPDQTGIGGGGILSGVLNSIGFGKKASYSQSVRQRFYNKSKNAPNFNRSIVIARRSRHASILQTTDETASKSIDQNSKITTKKAKSELKSDSLKYGDLINVREDGSIETSDQLLNYKTLIDNAKDFSDTFSDPQSNDVKNIIDNFNKSITNIIGVAGVNEKYSVGFGRAKTDLFPQQFGKMNNQLVPIKDGIGFNYLSNLKNNINEIGASNISYNRRFIYDEGQYNKTRMGRKISPTNDVDYVNSLEVLSKDDFKKYYSESDKYRDDGPDIINFYFYDIVNEKYIPFRATVKGINDVSTADWETIEYLGRPDKLYYYKGFTRTINLSFTVNAHSVKELMPMWQRINYLTGLTMPSNYTNTTYGGFMIPPMVQLTLGDFFKNHNVIITSCNVTIPDDASWETTSEKATTWTHGPEGAILWDSDKHIINDLNNATSKGRSHGRFGQFPRTAEISLNMNVLAKDRPKAGRAMWGDAPVPTVLTQIPGVYSGFKDDYSEKSYTDPSDNTFSKNIRHDGNIVHALDSMFDKRATETPNFGDPNFQRSNERNNIV